MPRNALWLPNLVTKTLDRSVTVNWYQRSCMGHLGSTRGQINIVRFSETYPNTHFFELQHFETLLFGLDHVS